MIQDNIFLQGEGNNWFVRNKFALDKAGKIDWPLYLLDQLANKKDIKSVVELGCSNGYRLERIRSTIITGGRYVGVDASLEAIEDGRSRYSDLDLYQGLLSDIPLEEQFDVVIINFVLHWIDRRSLVRSIGEIDRLVRNDGLLVLGDFLPDYQQRRRYHHLPNENVYTYKQDYSRIFAALGTYREITRITFDHDNSTGYTFGPTDSSVRGFCSMLHKSIEGYYPEV